MDASLFALKKFLAALAVPPAGTLLLALAGLLLMRWRPRTGRALALLGTGATLALMLPVTAGMLTDLATRGVTLPDKTTMAQAQAIVILAGGKREAPEYGGWTVNDLSLTRLRYGVKLARQTGLPVLLSGGVVHRGPPEATLMAAVMEQEFGLAPRWVESRSRDTHENARYSAQILKRAGISRVLLVSHAVHLRRADAEFAAAGIAVANAPTELRAPDDGETTLFDWLPSSQALRQSYLALHELIGYALVAPHGAAAQAHGDSREESAAGK